MNDGLEQTASILGSGIVRYIQTIKKRIPQNNEKRKKSKKTGSNKPTHKRIRVNHYE